MNFGLDGENLNVIFRLILCWNILHVLHQQSRQKFSVIWIIKQLPDLSKRLHFRKWFKLFPQFTFAPHSPQTSHSVLELILEKKKKPFNAEIISRKRAQNNLKIVSDFPMISFALKISPTAIV